MIAGWIEKLTAQMNEILHAPEFQQLESAWRGLHYVVFNSETDATLKIRVMNVSKTRAVPQPAALSRRTWDQSPLFKKVYEAEFGQLGGEPYGCLVGDYYFDHSPADVSCCATLARLHRQRMRRSSPAPGQRCWAWTAGPS